MPTNRPITRFRRRATVCVLVGALVVSACSESDETTTTDTTADTTAETTTDTAAGDTTTADATTADATIDEADDGLATTATFRIEVWADNWAAVYVDGELVGEDSVPITTERSFNSETFTFEASYPFTIAIEAKDFKETDSGIEYIGEQNQQMGDGGLIAQVTDAATGEVVAVTDDAWTALVVHRAPLNTDCEDDPVPDDTCEFEITETPEGWADADFDDSEWSDATEWSADAVNPKDGYGDIAWDSDAQFIWGADLEVDNTILLRYTVTG
ncbi:hypothetical protein BDK89_3792 [Ilumatobacter fluminis]|uniref:PEBP family protein n=1 Tax=Ilumatobacter fluminis TaxID=467091 RepID=A0A4R7I3X8_9ACTN|nr:hypothetical protein [Ilumatobacter fluminis]TDT18175.1 hypothetical protein BDK89_3792 [Ilumatobacter fluminis]